MNVWRACALVCWIGSACTRPMPPRTSRISKRPVSPSKRARPAASRKKKASAASAASADAWEPCNHQTKFLLDAVDMGKGQLWSPERVASFPVPIDRTSPPDPFIAYPKFLSALNRVLQGVGMSFAPVRTGVSWRADHVIRTVHQGASDSYPDIRLHNFQMEVICIETQCSMKGLKASPPQNPRLICADCKAKLHEKLSPFDASSHRNQAWYHGTVVAMIQSFMASFNVHLEPGPSSTWSGIHRCVEMMDGEAKIHTMYISIRLWLERVAPRLKIHLEDEHGEELVHGNTETKRFEEYDDDDASSTSPNPELLPPLSFGYGYSVPPLPVSGFVKRDIYTGSACMESAGKIDDPGIPDHEISPGCGKTSDATVSCDVEPACKINEDSDSDNDGMRE